MRDCTEVEKAAIRRGICPACKQSLFLGPQGGMSINLLCHNSECKARYNIAVLPDASFLLAEVVDESQRAWIKLDPRIGVKVTHPSASTTTPTVKAPW